MKGNPIVALAIIAALAIAAFAIQHDTNFEPASSVSIEKVKAPSSAVADTHVKITADSTLAERFAVAARYTAEAYGRVSLVSQAKARTGDLYLPKGIRFSDVSITSRTGPLLMEKTALSEQPGARYDKPGWIDRTGAVPDVQYVRRN